jgi:hypothetical protein
VTSPSIQCPQGTNNTGAYRISWKGPDGALYRLEENGKLLYQGPHTASTVTGRQAGVYDYRVGVLSDNAQQVQTWSEPCQVDVSPPSLALALTLFSLGLIVFLSTLILIVRGHRKHRREELQ